MTDLGEQWGALIAECDVAKAELDAAFMPVVEKFRLVATSESQENPTVEEIQRLDAARNKFNETRERINQFVLEST